jgi:hypothetical protein
VTSSANNAVQIYRIDYQLERVCNEIITSKPTSFVFSLNGKYSVIGKNDGKISLLKTENLQEVVEIPLGSGD